MKIEYKKTVKIDELAHLVPRKAGATWSALWQIFYYTRLLKYMHRRHYSHIKVFYNKICTDKNLHNLCDLGYFKSPQKNVYCATNKVLPILKEVGFVTDTLPSEPVGKGDINELNNTDAFITLMKEPHFYTFLYPNFGYIIPDALMIHLDRENKRYKFTFIEVEAKKPEWERYIEQKKQNYLRLSTDMQSFEKLNNLCQLIGFPALSLKTFKFSYKIIK